MVQKTWGGHSIVSVNAFFKVIYKNVNVTYKIK